MLYPRESETREVKDLGGLWKFKVDARNEGLDRGWAARPLEGASLMPVPASHNDLTQDPAVRDHVGWVWYEREFFVPESWRGRRVALRFGSATHHAVVWVNGREVARHRGGYMPFEADVCDAVAFGAKNRVTVAVDNVLDWTTIPPGQVRAFDDDMHPAGFRVQEIFHDFFNYSGIHRPVRLATTPRTYISDVTVKTEVDGGTGRVGYEVAVANGSPPVRVRLLDEEGRRVASRRGARGTLKVPEPRLWEPGNAYLYTLEIETLAADGEAEDVYRLPVGIRTIRVTEKQFLINGKPFYFKGFGKHEDADLRGKGADDVTNFKDFVLLRWLGANSFRTSHYPYAEEMMELADRFGVAVIDETPAVGLNLMPKEATFRPDRIGEASQESLLAVARELVQRDKNHPCVVMWSVANEAATHEEAAAPYFEKVFAEVRRLDPTRPVTIVTCYNPDTCRVTHMADVVCVNRYYSWYSDPGRLDLIEHQVERNLRAWHEKFRKPVMVTEYGADAVAGLHRDPPVMFSEEYQCEMLERFHRAFDRLDFVVGEHVWAFADFATKQEIRRVAGNRKGVFTRQRQPKAAAFLLRRRWSGERGRAE